MKFIKNFYQLFSNQIQDIKNQPPKQEGLSTFRGVFIPYITTVFGVILFMRIAVVTGNAGFSSVLLINLLSLILMLITTASLTSIITNFELEGGGIYYIISRTLGVEFGGAIGLSIFFSQVISIATCITGFAYSFKEIFPKISISLLETLALSGVIIISLVSHRLVNHVQTIVFLILMLALASIFFGSNLHFQGSFSRGSFYPESFGFWEFFAILYPAYTGCEIGLTTSEKLKRPAWSIGLGISLGLLFSLFVYLSLAFLSKFIFPENIASSDPYSLIHYAYNEQIVFLAIWFATLSGSLACLSSSSYMLQKLAQDGIVPRVLAYSFGKSQKPKWGMIFSGFLALTLALLTRIDQILPLLSVISLLCYTSINFIVFFGEISQLPSWRPRLHIPIIFTLTGVLLPLAFIFLMSPLWGFIGIALLVFFCWIIQRNNLNVHFHDFREAFLFFFSKLLLKQIEEPTQHIMTWQPNLLVPISSLQRSSAMVSFANQMTKGSGLLSFLTILLADTPSEKQNELAQVMKNHFSQLGINSLVELSSAHSLEEGICAYIKAYGISGMQPNTLLLGFPDPSNKLPFFLQIIEEIQFAKKNLILFHERSISEESFFQSYHQIHIWWDDLNRCNFDLILSYLSSFRQNEFWTNANVTIMASVTTVDSEKHIRDYFETFSKNCRFPISVQTILDPNELGPFTLASQYSSKADLVFFGLDLLSEENEGMYGDYLTHIYNNIVDLKNAACICCYDEINHGDLTT